MPKRKDTLRKLNSRIDKLEQKIVRMNRAIERQEDERDELIITLNRLRDLREQRV